MAGKPKSSIVIIGTVATEPITNRFGGHEVNVHAGNGDHYDRVVAAKDFPAVDSLIASLKKGDTVQFSNCYLGGFIYKGEACIKVSARAAAKL